ncbi:unnamed protein product [Ectocarpus sp. 13 AM-2016]
MYSTARRFASTFFCSAAQTPPVATRPERLRALGPLHSVSSAAPDRGTPPANHMVYATARSFLPQLEEAGVKDSAHCLFTFPSGAVFTLEMTRCSAYGYDNRIEVMGEKGMLSLGNPPSSGLEFFDSTGCSTSPPEHSFPQRFREVNTRALHGRFFFHGAERLRPLRSDSVRFVRFQLRKTAPLRENFALG